MKFKDLIIFIILVSFVFLCNLLIIKTNFSSSVERGRYALTQAIVEEKTLQIDSYKEFSYPDVSVKDGHYYSRFPAGMPFLMAPIHILAMEIHSTDPKIIHFGFLGLLSASTIGFLYLIGVLQNFTRSSSVLISFCFAFGTLIYAYSGGFWSHILSLFFITSVLLSFSFFLKQKNEWYLLLIGLLFGIALSIDFPNAIILSPLLFCIGYLSYRKGFVTIIKSVVLLGIPIVIILSSIALYSTATFGSPFAIGQSSKFSVGTKLQSSFVPMKQWNSSGVFDDRRLFPGLFTQLFSVERGLLIFSPLLLLSLLGFVPFLKENRNFAIVCLSTFGVTILFYSLWQDYWGGWSYGPRYLINTIPFLFLPALYFLRTYRESIMMQILFCITCIFGIVINVLGAFTAALLACPCEGYTGWQYSPLYAFDHINQLSKHSLFYTNYFQQYLTPLLFFLLLSSILIGVFLILYFVSSIAKEKK